MKIHLGKVVKSTRNQYLVAVGNNLAYCSIRGRIAGSRNEDSISVKTGDDVHIQMISENEGVICDVLPRRSKLSRAVIGKAYKERIVATNVDQMIIVMSVRHPQFKSGLLDRYLVIAEKNELRGIICCNKIDLTAPSQFEDYASCYHKLGYPFYFTSAKTGDGLEKIKSVLKGKVSVLVGKSGVGKSSLIKYIEPALDLKIKQTSMKTSKGKHTTSFVELFPLQMGGFIIVTPGIRELGLWDIYRDDLRKFYVEFVQYQNRCQFNDCLHLKEPGCAVKSAVESGDIFIERYKNYSNIYSDLRAAPYELLKRR
jgi:ribosome biogenesis GTPase